MRSTLIGLGFMGAAVMVGLASRNNTNETATQTFGTLGLILVLVLVGYSYVRAGERERLRSKGRAKKGPPRPKGAFPSQVVPGAPGPPTSGGGLDTESLQKAVIGILVVAVLLGGGYAAKTFLFQSDVGKLAAIESPSDKAGGEAALVPLLDKMANRFGKERSEVDSLALSLWTENEASLREYGLKPSSYFREVLQAAPKKAKLERVAGALAREKPESRLARLHQKKPAPGKYPQQAEFSKYLKQLEKKTGMEQEAIVSVLVRQWRILFQKKKGNRKYNLLWFVKKVNSVTGKTNQAKFMTKVAEVGHQAAK